MKQSTPSLQAVSASLPLPGTVLPMGEASSEREVREITVAMLPPQHAENLENFADTFGTGWFDPQNNRLRLQFHVVGIFSNAKTQELWLSVPGRDEKIPLAPANVASPAVGQRHPQLSWSAQSRFVLNEIVDLPSWATSSPQFDLVAGVAGKPEKLGVIYIGEACKGREKNNTLRVVPASAPPLASTPTQRPAPNNVTLLARRIVARIMGMNRLFLLTVLLPTLISCIYFGFVASDVYISESRFVVRSPQNQTGIGLGALIKGAGFSSSHDDSYAVHDYIFSRDALKQLDTQLALGKVFSSSQVDIISRFAGLGWDNSFEALSVYYQKHVTLDLDTSSSISTLSVRAYSAETAYQINEALLEMSEALVNQLNERGRVDMINFANREVAEAEKKDKEATLALARIQTESTKIAEGGRSLVSRYTEHQRLTLEKEFADKMLAMALNSLEDARSQALRKQLYLERIVQPGKPDAAVEPRRIRNIFATLALGLIAWGILTMLIAGVREHQD